MVFNTYQNLCTSKITKLNLMGERINLQLCSKKQSKSFKGKGGRGGDSACHNLYQKMNNIPEHFEASHPYGKPQALYEYRPAP